MKKCPTCQIIKPLDLFSKNKNRKDGLQRECKACIASYQSKHYQKDKDAYQKRIKQQTQKVTDYIDDYKKAHNCIKCGESRHYVLDFHHIDPTQKEEAIGNLKHTGSFLKVKNEIKKCVMLCKNCHSEFHHMERENNITIEQYLGL